MNKIIILLFFSILFSIPVVNADVTWPTGTNWTRLTNNTFPNAGSYDFPVVVYQGKMWAFGGDQPDIPTHYGGYSNDTMYSIDGITWSNLGEAPWTARMGHGAVVHNGLVYLWGGFTGNVYHQDVWSFNGTTWTLINATAGVQWGPTASRQTRGDFGYASYINKIWMLGGATAASCENTVYSSTDGDTWILENNSAWTLGRSKIGAVVFQNKLWITGGYVASGSFCTVGPSNEVWNTDNGSLWAQVTTTGANGHVSHGLVVFNNGTGDKMYNVGGTTSNSPVDYSTDGTNWSTLTANAEFGTIQYSRALAYNNTIYMVGGYWLSGINRRNQTWYTLPGASITATKSRQRLIYIW